MQEFLKDILQTQLCSVCRKYLSVRPIKVYPNRQVKCGRCIESNDNGVESKLYLTVVQDILFPCINSFEGCDEHLILSEMKEHETICKENQYTCPICRTFEGSAFDLSLHCEILHKKETMQSKAFCVDLDEGNKERCYFYHLEKPILFINFKFEMDTQEMGLNVSFADGKYRGDILQFFTLYSVENEIIFKTNKVFCHRLSSTMQESGFNIDISSLKFVKNVIFCELSIMKKPYLSMNRNLLIIDPMLNSFVARCVLDRVSKVSLVKAHFFPEVYYLLGIPWKVAIKQTGTTLTAFLCWLRIDNYEPKLKSCKVDANFTLVSKNNLSIKRYFNQTQIYRPGKIWGPPLEEICYILDPKNGFIQNDSITIEVNVKMFVFT